jgi:type I restriction enzyme, S subunit
MGVSAGYKETAAGIIPEEWVADQLGNFISLQRGHDLTWRDRRVGEIPVMGSAGLNGFHDKAIAKGPGVVLGRSGASFGQAHYCEQDFWPHNTALYVTDFRGNDPLFVFYFLSAIDFSRHNSGGAQQSLNRNFIATVPIGVPLPPEQRAIANALSNVDALLDGLDRLIAKKRYLKQVAMQQLLTGKSRLPGFESEWETMRLADVSAFITKGSTPTTYGFGWQLSGVLFLRSECVSPEGLDLAQSMFISAEAHRVLRRSAVQSNDLLITITGNVGRVVRLPGDFGEANINQHIARIRIVDAATHPGWVYHFLSQPGVQQHFEKITTGQAYPQISLAQVRDAVIPRPAISEQREISAALDDMDGEITVLKARRDKTRDLKRAMMQELLSGRTRLVPAGAAHA